MKTARREIEGRPVLAVCYDFDKTLSPEDMQAQGYIRLLVMMWQIFGKNPIV